MAAGGTKPTVRMTESEAWEFLEHSAHRRRDHAPARRPSGRPARLVRRARRQHLRPDQGPQGRAGPPRPTLLLLRRGRRTVGPAARRPRGLPGGGDRPFTRAGRAHHHRHHRQVPPPTRRPQHDMPAATRDHYRRTWGRFFELVPEGKAAHLGQQQARPRIAGPASDSPAPGLWWLHPIPGPGPPPPDHYARDVPDHRPASKSPTASRSMSSPPGTPTPSTIGTGTPWPPCSPTTRLYVLSGFGQLDDRYEGFAAIRALMESSDSHPVAHHVTNVVVTVEGGDVRMTSKIVGAGPPGPGRVGRLSRPAAPPARWLAHRRAAGDPPTSRGRLSVASLLLRPSRASPRSLLRPIGNREPYGGKSRRPAQNQANDARQGTVQRHRVALRRHLKRGDGRVRWDRPLTRSAGRARRRRGPARR